MSRYSGLTWNPSPNFSPGPTSKVRVVLHRMAGAYAGGLSWLTDPRSQVSAHFTVDNVSGSGCQLVDTADIAWAEAAFNPTSISIEIGGQTTDPVSDTAWATVISIVRQAHQVDGVPLVLSAVANDPGLSYHGLLGAAGGGHSDCPGPVVLAKRPAILTAAGSPQPLPPETHDMDDNTFVRWCYMTILLRTVDASGFAANMQWLSAGGPRAQVYTNLCDSPEGRAATNAIRARLGLAPA